MQCRIARQIVQEYGLQEKLENPKVKKFNLPQKLEYINQAGYARAVLTPEKLKNILNRQGSHGTISIGAHGTAMSGIAGTAAIQYSFDRKGNVVLQVVYGGGGGGVSASTGLYVAFTNARDVYNLEGKTLQVGGSGGEGLVFGGDFLYLNRNKATKENYQGGSVNVGAGLGLVDIHAMITDTETINKHKNGTISNLLDIPFFYDACMNAYDNTLIKAIKRRAQDV